MSAAWASLPSETLATASGRTTEWLDGPLWADSSNLLVSGFSLSPPFCGLIQSSSIG